MAKTLSASSRPAQPVSVNAEISWNKPRLNDRKRFWSALQKGKPTKMILRSICRIYRSSQQSNYRNCGALQRS